MAGEPAGRSIVARVRRTLDARALVPQGTIVLLGVSGGPDSAAMLAALHALAPNSRLSLHAASVDHGLRANAADDVEIARQQAARLGIPFHALSLGMGAGAGLQARARALRYEALLACAATIGATRLAVGHTRDDQAETVLMRTLRGAGLRGLAAIAPRRADGVVRPLIDCPRPEVHAFAKAAFGTLLAWDPSNLDTHYERVRVRNDLMPALCAEDPQAHRHLADLADEAREVKALLSDLARDALLLARQDPEILALSFLRQVHRGLLPVIFQHWLSEEAGITASRAHLEQLAACLSGRGEVWLKEGWLVQVEFGEQLRLTRRASERPLQPLG